MSAARNRQWRLRRRPARVVQSDFELADGAVPTLQDGQILVRNVYLSIDPTQRLWRERRRATCRRSRSGR